MILKCMSFEQMNKEMTEQDMSIVVFGAGVIGTVTVPEILKQYDLWSRVLFYVDNRCREYQKMVNIGNKAMDIRSVDQLNNVGKNTVIIIAISRYAEALEQLGNMACTSGMTVYIMPIMCIHNFCSGSSDGLPLLEDKPLIPKKIHYMWLGKKPIPDNLQKCIDSWKRYCPDYEIIQWDESSYDISKNRYMKQAYEVGAYGFVPDYARLDILYQYGGIYMDTDVEVVRNLDDMLYQGAFCGVEKWQTINFGGCSGAVKGHEALRQMLDYRKNLSFLCEDGSQNKTTCGFYDTNVALRNGYIMNGKTQNIMEMNIYAFDYFHPYDYMSGQTVRTKNTYTIHWFNGGWLDEKTKKDNRNTVNEYNRVYQECIKNQ
ncbi:hypothetical protein D3Z45_14955 [Lachnospiraceae bacterium]|nr:hypothetical protein [Lachnospiraceae bacterium]